MGKKPSGRLNRGPFTAADFERLLKSEGCVEEVGGSHPTYRHPTTNRKVPISRKWTSVRCGDPIFQSFMQFFGVKKKTLLKMLDDC